MEKRVDSLVFRRMTYADFRHINKVGGEEEGGGGQSYIDFPIREVPAAFWFSFLGQNTGLGAGNRPQWDFEINSLGMAQPQTLRIYQRRPATFSIAAQKIHSNRANRVRGWHPDNGFPVDYDPSLQNLVIYIIKTFDGQYWAGWFLEDQIPANWIGNRVLQMMFHESAGSIKVQGKLYIDTNNSLWPFHFYAEEIGNEIPTNEDLQDESILEDTSPRLQELINSGQEPELIARFLKIRKRNNRLVRNLKRLYGGRCQISGENFTFKKQNGELYCEVHHLIPLGEKGSDSYENTIVVSPLIHRMLHYAKVSEIDLSKIENHKLNIEINGVQHTIEWHPQHLDTVQDILA